MKQIAELIKELRQNNQLPAGISLLTNNGVEDISSYFAWMRLGSPLDAYAYIDRIACFNIACVYPYIFFFNDFVKAYLSKLGFSDKYLGIAPAQSLKYFAYAIDAKRGFIIDIGDIDVIVTNTGLRKVVFDVVGHKIFSGDKNIEELWDIIEKAKSNKIFAGYNFDEAVSILKEYADGKTSYLDKVAKIEKAYLNIFPTYRVCYNATWREIICGMT
ncbi:MAG: hypothetical protein OWQ50_05095 [Acidianus infernus]|nr:hypothetical protein [Acidianus infernus]